MRTLDRHVLSITVVAALLAGCSGSQQPNGLPQTTSLGVPQSGLATAKAPNTLMSGKVPLLEKRKRKKPLAPTTVYVADQYNDEIIEYPAGVPNPAPKGTISLPGMPLSLAEDSSGDLYVGLTNLAGVDIYNSSGKLVRQLNGNNGVNCLAYGLTFDSNGFLYVSQGPSNSPPCGPIGPEVLEFGSASDQPSYIYQAPAAEVAQGLATDAEENVYVAGVDGPLSKFPQRSQQAALIAASLNVGVAILPDGDIAVSGSDSVRTYASAYPYAEIGQISYGSGSTPWLIATASDGTLYVPVKTEGTNGTVYVYPPNTAAPYTITQGLKEGSGLGPIAVAAGL